MKVKETEKKKEEEEDDVVEDENDKESEEEDSGEAAAETDNVGDASVEINVEELIHELEVDNGSHPGREQAAKKRLEDLMERKRAKRELEDFDDYEV
jgi:hypothetical protein